MNSTVPFIHTIHFNIFSNKKTVEINPPSLKAMFCQKHIEYKKRQIAPNYPNGQSKFKFK